MAAYSRQSTFTDGDTISASLFNNEYDALAAAFVNTSGHKHDGTTGEGPVIGVLGDAGVAVPLNKILIDSSNNHIEFYVDVSSSAVQQMHLEDGKLLPNVDSDIDLGSSTKYFANAFIDAITTTGNVTVGGNLVVTGTTTFNGGTLTLGDADTDNIVFGGEVDSNIIPDDDDTHDLGSSSKEWKDIYIDGTAYLDAINFNGTAITSTAAELNILDGVTASAADINLIDGITNGTVIADKAIVTDSNKDITGGRNITISGELDAATLDISGDVDVDGTLETDALSINGTAITSTAAEINILDGVTASAADINLIDGITNGTVIASKAIITDSNKDISGGRNITISGELDAATLDISGDADIDGTTNLDDTDIDGTLVVDGSNISLDSTSTLNIDNSNTSNGITIGTATSGVPISIGHSTSEVTVNDNLTVTGDLTVSGTTTTVNSTTVNLNDHNLVLDSGNSTSAVINGAGITIEGGSGDDATFSYNTSGPKFELKLGSSHEDLEVAKLIGTELDISGDVDIDGTLETDALSINGTTVTSTGAELNILDGVTATASEINALDGITSTVSELNILDGDTGASSVTIVDADQIILNDNGTMKQVAVSALNSYTSSSIAADDIGTGDAAINLTTSTGNITIDAQGSDTDIIFKGTDGSSDITALTLDMSAAGAATFNDKIIATELDISGDVDIDGTLEADAITIDGTTLAETISDTVGAMVGSNTETGISVTYDDSDNTLDFVLGSSQTTISSLTNTSLVIGRDADNDIDFATDNNIIFRASGADQIKLQDGALVPVTTNDIDLGTSSLEFKDAFFDGTVTADAFAGPLTGNVTGNVSGTAATVTGAAQSNITSLGTLTTLTVDNVIVNGTTIGHTDDTDLMTVADGVLTVAGEVSMTTLDIGGVNVTSTAAELNILDGVTSTATELNILDGVTATTSEINTLDGITAVVGELNALDLGSTAVGTAIASKAVVLDSNKDYTGIRNLTITGELDAASLDISGNADIDGTLEADAITIEGVAVTAGGASAGFAVAMAIAL